MKKEEEEEAMMVGVLRGMIKGRKLMREREGVRVVLEESEDRNL